MKERGVFERRLLFFLACIAGAVFSAVLFLSPLDVSAKLYQPGETLNPDCAPGTADCGIIRDSLVESKNKIITATTTKNEIWSQFENNSPGGVWGGKDLSLDGRYQIAVGEEGLFQSSDFGTTWTENDSLFGSESVSMSDDGKYRIVGRDYIFVSSDYGETWEEKGTDTWWGAAEMSSSGKYQLIFESNCGKALLSSDYGETWEEAFGERCWVSSPIISGNGKYMFLYFSNEDSDYSEGIISKDYGETWENVEVEEGWGFGTEGFSRVFSFSSDGKYQMYFLYNYDDGEGKVYTSSDYGEAFSLVFEGDFDNLFFSHISEDGKYQLVSFYYQGIYTSSDYGETWSMIPGSENFLLPHVSANGQHVIFFEEIDDEYVLRGSNDYFETNEIILENFISTYSEISKDGRYFIGSELGGVSLATFFGESQEIFKKIVIGTTTPSHNMLTVVGGLTFPNGLPEEATNTLYAVGGELYWNGEVLGGASSVVTLESEWNTEFFDFEEREFVERGETKEWVDIAMSASGRYQTAIERNQEDDTGNIFRSSDYGTTWEETGSLGSWYSIAMSADGKYQTLGSFGDGLFMSSDYGVTWEETGSLGYWYSITMSADGSYQVALDGDGVVHISSDHGETWSVSESHDINFSSFAMSGDGRYQTGITNEYVYISSDYGETWEAARSGNWNGFVGVAMSSSGEYQMIKNEDDGYLYTSSNYGETWIENELGGDINDFAISNDGEFFVVVGYNDVFYISSDGGANWLEIESSGNFSGVALSSDGKYITGVEWMGNILTYNAGLLILHTSHNVSIGTSTTFAGLTVAGGVGIINGTPATTTNTLYAVGGDLYWNGSILGSEGISGLSALLSSQEGGVYVGKTKISENQWYLGDERTMMQVGNLGDWKNIAMSGDGRYQIASNLSFENSKLYTSSDFGATWTSGEEGSWYDFAMSADGKYILGINSMDEFYISSNYGGSWTLGDITGAINGIAMSADGKYQMITHEENGCLYSSSDYGATWTQGENCENWSIPAMSADGKYRVIKSDNDGYLYLSSDYGINWGVIGDSGQWYDFAISLDGRYQIGSGEFYENESFEYRFLQSSDFGESWEVVATSTDSIPSVVLSDNGKYRAVARYNSSLLVSSDYGETWEELGESEEWMSVAMSSDAKYIVAAAWNGYIQIFIANSYIYGNVGIGTSTSNSALTVAGTSTFNGNVLLATGTLGLGLSSVGEGYIFQLPNDSGLKAQAYAWDTYSDSRVKTDQELLNYGLQEIMKLVPKRYIHHTSAFEDGELILKDGIETIGLVAQEVYTVIPEIVHKPTDEQKALWGLDYSKLVPVVVKALQEQQEMISLIMNAEGLGEGELEDVATSGGLSVGGEIVFGKDTVGQVSISSGSKDVVITFEKEYIYNPIITVTPLDFIQGQYKVSSVSKYGFAIILSEFQSNDVSFGWHAFGNGSGIPFTSANNSSETTELNTTDVVSSTEDVQEEGETETSEEVSGTESVEGGQENQEAQEAQEAQGDETEGSVVIEEMPIETPVENSLETQIQGVEGVPSEENE